MPKQQAQTHDVHTDASGRYAWVEGGGIYHMPPDVRAFDASVHPEQQSGRPMDMGVVVLRCQCPDDVKADPAKLAARHGTTETGALRHCPGAQVDVAESFMRSAEFTVLP